MKSACALGTAILSFLVLASVVQPLAGIAGDLQGYGVVMGPESMSIAAGGTIFTVPGRGTFEAWAQGAGAGSILDGTVTGPGSSPVNLTIAGPLGRYWQESSTLSSVETSHPAGLYTLATDTAGSGRVTASLSLPAAAYLPVPVIANLSALVTLDASREQTVTWTPLANPNTNQMVRLSVCTASGVETFSTPRPGLAGALAGNASSAVIPSSAWATNTPGVSTFFLYLTVYQLATVDRTTVPGAVGVCGFSSTLTAMVTPTNIGVRASTMLITNYGLVVGRVGDQTSASAPQVFPTYTVSAWAYITDTNAAATVTLADPSGNALSLQDAAENGQWTLTGSFTNLAALNLAFPPGNYTFQLQATGACPVQASLPLASSGFPVTPQVLNYANLQAVDPASATPIQWAPFTGASANDSVQLTVSADDTGVVFQTPGAGQPGALTAATLSTNVPADTFLPGHAYAGQLSFFHASGTDTADFGGATGTIGRFTETDFSLHTTGIPLGATNQLIFGSPTNLPPMNTGQESFLWLSAGGAEEPLTWSLVRGALPAGLTLVTNTGQITGYPHAAGTYPVGIRVSDATGQSLDRDFVITVQGTTGPLSLLVTNLSSGVEDQFYAQSLAAAGGVPPYSWQLGIGSSLPNGLVLDSQVGIIYGDPEHSGAFPVTIVASDALGQRAQCPAMLTIAPRSSPSFVRIPGCSLVSNGLCQLEVTGPANYSYTVESSPDLKTWTTVLVTNDLILDPVQFPLAPGVRQAFFRVKLGQPVAPTSGPWNVQAVLDTNHWASSCIGPQGGTMSLTDGYGIKYTLAVPTNAFLQPTLARMTAILGLANASDMGSGLGGVRLEPDGTRLNVPATLTIVAPTAFATDMTGFCGEGLGTDYGPMPAQIQGNQAVLSVAGFTVFRVDKPVLPPRSPCSEATKARARLAAYMTTLRTQRSLAGLLKIYRDWGYGVLANKVQPAQKDDALLQAAEDEVQAYKNGLQSGDVLATFLFGEDLDLPVVTDNGLLSELDQMRDGLGNAFLLAAARARVKCLCNEDVNEGLKILLLEDLAKAADSRGLLNSDIADLRDFFNGSVRDCLHFKYSFQGKVNTSTWVATNDPWDSNPHLDTSFVSFGSREKGQINYVSASDWTEAVYDHIHTYADEVDWNHPMKRTDTPAQAIPSMWAIIKYEPTSWYSQCSPSPISAKTASLFVYFDTGAYESFRAIEPVHGWDMAATFDGAPWEACFQGFINETPNRPLFGFWPSCWEVTGGKNYASMKLKRTKNAGAAVWTSELKVQIEFAPQ